MWLLHRMHSQIIKDITLIIVPSVSTSLPPATTAADKVSEVVEVVEAEVVVVGGTEVAAVADVVVDVVVDVVECLHSRAKELHSKPCLTGKSSLKV
jgi:hypothetical protein